MKTYMDCIPCFVRQTLELSRMITEDPAKQEEIMRGALNMTAQLDFSDSPPALAREIHAMAREISGNPDPYLAVKKKYNRFAMDLLPELEEQVARSDDPFQTAVRLAIAGNIIDFGVHSDLTSEKVHQCIDEALEAPIDHEHLEALRKAVSEATDILYLGDNTGEIVLDRLLLERLPKDKVTFVVKGSPILNDATMDDAREVGITQLVKVIDNGDNVPGTILATCSESFQERFRQADLVIAKGQGNYETLSGEDQKIFFLLKAKCPVIARDIGCPLGSIVIQEKRD